MAVAVAVKKCTKPDRRWKRLGARAITTGLQKALAGLGLCTRGYGLIS